MQCANGKTLTVGCLVAFSKWDDSGKKPVESRHVGIVTALTGQDRRDERAGEVSFEHGNDKYTVATGAVEVVTDEEAAKIEKPEAAK